MDANALIVQHMLDRQEEIASLRAENDRLTQENADLSEALNQATAPPEQ